MNKCNTFPRFLQPTYPNMFAPHGLYQYGDCALTNRLLPAFLEAPPLGSRQQAKLIKRMEKKNEKINIGRNQKKN